MSATILEADTVTSGATLSGPHLPVRTGGRPSLLGRLLGRGTAGAARAAAHPVKTAARGCASTGRSPRPLVATAETAVEGHDRFDRPSSLRRIASGALRGLRTRRRTGFGA